MKKTKRDQDLLLTLLVLDRWSLMPELLDFFDGDASRVLAFIDIFGGTVIKVPTRERMAVAARNLHIWSVLKRQESDQRDVGRLAGLYGLTPRQIRQVRDQTAEEVHALNRDQ